MLTLYEIVLGLTVKLMFRLKKCCSRPLLHLFSNPRLLDPHNRANLLEGKIHACIYDITVTWLCMQNEVAKRFTRQETVPRHSRLQCEIWERTDREQRWSSRSSRWFQRLVESLQWSGSVGESSLYLVTLKRVAGSIYSGQRLDHTGPHGSGGDTLSVMTSSGIKAQTSPADRGVFHQCVNGRLGRRSIARLHVNDSATSLCLFSLTVKLRRCKF